MDVLQLDYTNKGIKQGILIGEVLVSFNELTPVRLIYVDFVPKVRTSYDRSFV